MTRVALAGGTGFTGRRVAARLAGAGHELRCLVRATSDRSVLPQGAHAVEGDLGDPASLDAWLARCEQVVYCASMGFGQIPDVVSALDRAGVTRAVFVSTTALFTSLPAASKAVRIAAEDAVRGGAFAWTIVRPTMIYGAPGDRNMERLLRLSARWPCIPVPGRGRSLLQPVHVEDLADGIVSAFGSDVAAGRAYDLSGAAPLPLRRVIDLARSAVGRSPRRLHIPLTPVLWTLRALEAVGLRPRIKAEQVLRLAENKAFEHAAAQRDFGFSPRAFEVGIVEEARLLGLAPEERL